MLAVRGAPFLSGIVHHAAYMKSPREPLDTTLELLRDPTLQVIEGAWAPNAPGKAEIRSALDASGAEVVYCFGGLMRRQGIDPNSLDASVRAVSWDKMTRLIDAAYDYGAKLVVLCSGPDVAAEDRPRALGHLDECLRHLCAHVQAAASGREPLWIGFEHFDRTMDQKRLLGPTAETYEFIRAIRDDHVNIGITLDLSHVVQLGEDVRTAVREAGNLVIHAHVANCGLDSAYPDLFGDSHCRFGLPGGAVSTDDVATFLDELFACGLATRPLPTRLPVVSLELKPALGEDPLLLISNGRRVLNDAVERINMGG